MHLLWLIPEYYSFLREELESVASLVERCSVICQSPVVAIPGVHGETIPGDRWTPGRIVRRVGWLTRTFGMSPLPRASSDVQSLRRLARHNEWIAEYVRREKVDVIHSHFAVPEGTAGWQAAGSVPVILTLRGVDILTIPDIEYGFSLDAGYRRRLRAAFRRVSAVTVASSETRDAAVRAGADPARTHLIPNGVDTARFRRSSAAETGFRTKFGLPPGTIVAGAGNLTVRKSFDILIRAFAEVAASMPDATLVIAGDGPDRPRLEGIAAALPVAARVRFVGPVSRTDMPGLYSAASVFVHPARAEGFGNVVLEAIACGCAVIVTPTGAGRDIVVDQVNGLIVRPGDVAHLVEALGLLLAQPDRRAALVVAGERVRDSLTLPARASAFIDLYERVRGQAPRHAQVRNVS